MANDDNLKPAKPGEVRNPNGRGRGVRNRSTIAKAILELEVSTPSQVGEALKAIFPDIQSRIDGEELASLVMLHKAIVLGDSKAYQVLMDSAYGAPKQQVETSNSYRLIRRDDTNGDIVIETPDDDEADV